MTTFLFEHYVFNHRADETNRPGNSWLPPTNFTVFALSKNTPINLIYAEDFLVGGTYQEFEVEIVKYIKPDTLTGFDQKTSQDRLIDKPAIEVGTKGKILVLNKTNQGLIRHATGSSSPADWVGKKITLHACHRNYSGEDLPFIRIKVPKTARLRKALKTHLGTPLTGEESS